MFSDIPMVLKSAGQGHPQIKTEMADIGRASSLKFLLVMSVLCCFLTYLNIVYYRGLHIQLK